MKWKVQVLGALLAGTIAMGCGHTGFVSLSEPAAPAFPGKPLPVYAAKDVGRPYQVLGYVFRSTEGHKSGLEAVDDFMHVLSQGSEEMMELRREALARGADAVVAFEMIPTLNGWGQPVGFSVGGLAVKFLEGEAPAKEPPPAGASEPETSVLPAPPSPPGPVDAPTTDSVEAPTDNAVEPMTDPPQLP